MRRGGGGRRRAAGSKRKTRTPHSDVGKNNGNVIIYIIYIIIFVTVYRAISVESTVELQVRDPLLFHVLRELPGLGHGEGEARHHAEEHVVVVGPREVHIA